jgi:hypothetical protein
MAAASGNGPLAPHKMLKILPSSLHHQSILMDLDRLIASEKHICLICWLPK